MAHSKPFQIRIIMKIENLVSIASKSDSFKLTQEWEIL